MPQRTQQVAALPWRMGNQGVEILLVTTRTTKRWLIPKGWVMEGKSDQEAAAIEAFEEAGVRGDLEPKSLGSYGYLKVLREGKARHVNVVVYAMRVRKLLDDWPEREERQRQWFDQSQALAMIGEPELLPIVAAFEGHDIGASPETAPRFSLFETLKSWWQKL